LLLHRLSRRITGKHHSQGMGCPLGKIAVGQTKGCRRLMVVLVPRSGSAKGSGPQSRAHHCKCPTVGTQTIQGTSGQGRNRPNRFQDPGQEEGGVSEPEWVLDRLLSALLSNTKTRIWSSHHRNCSGPSGPDMTKPSLDRAWRGFH